jgi:hypothetical protein
MRRDGPDQSCVRESCAHRRGALIAIRDGGNDPEQHSSASITALEAERLSARAT